MALWSWGQKVSTRDAISTCWRSWGEENICFFSFSSQSNNKWGRDKGLKTFIISIRGVVLLPLTSIWHKNVMESGFALDPVSSYAEKKDLKCSNIQRISWNIFWLWGRTLIRLLSHQPLAQTAGRLFGRRLLFFCQSSFHWLVLALRSHCLEWHLPVASFCKCNSPGSALLFHRKHFSLYNLTEYDVLARPPVNPPEWMWLATLASDFSEQWHWASIWGHGGGR